MISIIGCKYINVSEHNFIHVHASMNVHACMHGYMNIKQHAHACIHVYVYTHACMYIFQYPHPVLMLALLALPPATVEVDFSFYGNLTDTAQKPL